jgi:hypothetical protein
MSYPTIPEDNMPSHMAEGVWGEIIGKMPSILKTVTTGMSLAIKDLLKIY